MADDTRAPETVRWLTRAELERRQAAGTPPRAEVVVRTPEAGDTGGVAVLRLYDVIDPFGGLWGISASEVADALDEVPAGVTQVDVHINSPGGDAREGVTIANLLRQHPTRVVTIVDGLAASAASMIALAGDELVMAPSSQLMIHDASGGAWGPAAWIRKTADILDHLSDRYAEAYAAKAGGTTAEWRARMVEEVWYSPQEAIDAGLADRLLAAGDSPATGPGSVTETDEPDLESEDGDPLLARFRAGLRTAARAGGPRPPAARRAPGASAAAGGTSRKEPDAMSDTLIQGLRERLGFAENADEATILSAVDEALDEKADPPAASQPVPAAALAEVSRLSNELAELRAAQAKRDKDEKFAAWLREGKTSPAERAQLERMYDAAPEQTVALIDARAVGSVIPVAEIGHADAGAEADMEAEFASLFSRPFAKES